MKIRTVVAGLFHADGPTGGQTDITKQIVAIHNLTNSPKNICAILQLVILNLTKIAAIKICDSRSVTTKYLMTVKRISQVSFPNRNYFRGLFIDTVSDLGYIESNGRMIHERYFKVH